MLFLFHLGVKNVRFCIVYKMLLWGTKQYLANWVSFITAERGSYRLNRTHRLGVVLLWIDDIRLHHVPSVLVEAVMRPIGFTAMLNSILTPLKYIHYNFTRYIGKSLGVL